MWIGKHHLVAFLFVKPFFSVQFVGAPKFFHAVVPHFFTGLFIKAMVISQNRVILNEFNGVIVSLVELLI